jgi:hypothetical protein
VRLAAGRLRPLHPTSKHHCCIYGLCGRLRPTPHRRGAAPTTPLGAGALPPNPLAMIMSGGNNNLPVHALPLKTTIEPL